MARMYPERLHADEVDSSYERELFALLRDHLPADYTVFYSVRYQLDRPEQGGIEDREVDFVVAHPQHGLLCIEAKGGYLRIDARSGRWFAAGRKAAQRSPLRQANEATYCLLRWLKGRPDTGKIKWPIWWAAALPSVVVPPDAELEAGQPRAVVLDKRDLHPDRVADSIARVYAHYARRDGPHPPGLEGIAVLEQALARSWYLTSRLAADFADEDRRIKELTEAQYKLLRQMEHNPRMLITGSAGAGKTMLALEKAHRLAQAGLRVLLTCYNVNLAHELQAAAPADPRLTIGNFHAFADAYARRAGVDLRQSVYGPPGSPLPPEYFDAVLPMALSEAARLSEERYDAVVVDEGQDFRATYWPPLRAVLARPWMDVFYIFSDDNQRIYSDDALPFTSPTFHLGDNLRNTREIGELVGDYHGGRGYYAAAGPVTHRPPEFLDPAAHGGEAAALAAALDRLAEEGVEPAQIVVLTPRRRHSLWQDGAAAGRWTLRADVAPAGTSEIGFTTIHSFKGLERPVVILTELDQLPEAGRTELLYVALSRARNHLVVIGALG